MCTFANDFYASDQHSRSSATTTSPKKTSLFPLCFHIMNNQQKQSFYLPANPFCLSNKMLMKLFGLRALLILQLFFKTHAIKSTIKILSPAIALLSWRAQCAFTQKNTCNCLHSTDREMMHTVIKCHVTAASGSSRTRYHQVYRAFIQSSNCFPGSFWPESPVSLQARFMLPSVYIQQLRQNQNCAWIMTQLYHFQRETENIEMFAVRVEALFHSLFLLESLLCQLPCNMFIFLQ